MPPTVFISYNRRDARWKEELVRQLGVLQRGGLVETWHDGLIQPGTDWLPAIESAMAEARVAVFIVSVDFLNSDFILRNEIPTLMERRRREGMPIIPVIARPCPWQKVTWLAAIQVWPLNGKTLAGLGGVKAEKVLSDLAEEVLLLAERTAGFTSEAPDLRLGRQDSEVPVLVKVVSSASAAPMSQAPISPASPAGTPPTAVSATDQNPVREAVSRATAPRGLDNPHQEERGVVGNQLALPRRNSVPSRLAWGLFFVLTLMVLGIGGASWWVQRSEKKSHDMFAGRDAMAWASHLSAPIAHIVCAYRIRVPKNHGDLLLEGIVQGTGVLVKPGFVLTAKHVIQPWKVAFTQWDQLMSRYDVRPEYDRLEVQFPGQQLLTATLSTISGKSDLALLEVPPTIAPPPPLVASNADVKVNDRILVIGYTADLGGVPVRVKNLTVDAGNQTESVDDITPTFVLGVVTHPPSATESHMVTFNASVTRDSIGGVLLNDKGMLIGVISHSSMRQQPINFFGAQIIVNLFSRPGHLAVSPDDIHAFLHSCGII
jgi:Trypsin-like peptidase domain/TIR domain